MADERESAANVASGLAAFMDLSESQEAAIKSALVVYAESECVDTKARLAEALEALGVAVEVMRDLGACRTPYCSEPNCRRGIVTAERVLGNEAALAGGRGEGS